MYGEIKMVAETWVTWAIATAFMRDVIVLLFK
jgi:hypothetical protein